MNRPRILRSPAPCLRSCWQVLVLCFAVTGLTHREARAQETVSAVELDRVVAAVNGRPILASDLDDEIRLSVLESNAGARGVETPQEALQRLIARVLIRQQIREEDEQSLVATKEEVMARLTDLRRQLPACVNANCETDAGWKSFLDAHGLSQQQVEAYLRSRIEVLRFIEQRFRQGTYISREEVEAYYRDTLLPQYPPGQPVPPFDDVSKRIEEILLQRQVTALFTGWLDNLRSQGDIEVLDPSLDAASQSQVDSLRATPAQKGPAVR